MTATESDYAHAQFMWPTGDEQPEAGGDVKFVIKSRAGIEGNYEQINLKSVAIDLN